VQHHRRHAWTLIQMSNIDVIVLAAVGGTLLLLALLHQLPA
jgi:hypothetical protein